MAQWEFDGVPIRVRPGVCVIAPSAVILIGMRPRSQPFAPTRIPAAPGSAHARAKGVPKAVGDGAPILVGSISGNSHL